MSDVNTTVNYSAGNITLTGWVSDFVFPDPPGNGSDQFLMPVGSFVGTPTGAFVFEWADLTPKGSNFPSTVGSDCPQQIGIVDSSGGTDLVSLTLTFDSTEGGLSIYNSTGSTDLLDADGTSTLTLGGPSGESSSQLIQDLRNLQVVNNHHANFFDITFNLTDITDAGASQAITEQFATACYAPGTRIATPAGEVTVEELQIGDLIATASGESKPVKWLGRRAYPAAAVAEFTNLRPVLIREGALASGLPRRDLMVSPMHALFIDGAFVPAAALVNGVSIVRHTAAGPVEYIHIELDGHEVIFAEGTPAETFVNDNSRALFDNVSEYYDLYGTAESRPTFSAPRLEEGYQLEAVRHRLAARAGIASVAAVPGELSGHVERLEDGVLEGWVMDPANPATPVELEVLVDGEIVATLLANRYRVDLDRAGLAGGSCAFTVAMPAAAAGLAQIEVRRATDGRALPLPRRARTLELTELSTSR